MERIPQNTRSGCTKAAWKIDVGHPSRLWCRCTGKKYLSLKRGAPEEGGEPMGATRSTVSSSEGCRISLYFLGRGEALRMSPQVLVPCPTWCRAWELVCLCCISLANITCDTCMILCGWSARFVRIFRVETIPGIQDPVPGGKTQPPLPPGS